MLPSHFTKSSLAKTTSSLSLPEVYAILVITFSLDAFLS